VTLHDAKCGDQAVSWLANGNSKFAQSAKIPGGLKREIDTDCLKDRKLQKIALEASEVRFAAYTPQYL
jgi:hypothetical protein